MIVQELVEAARKAHEHQPDLAQLVDESVISMLALSHFEVVTLASFLLDQEYAAALDKSGLRPAHFKAAATSLQERGLVVFDGNAVNITGTSEVARMQSSLEAEQQALALAEAEDREPPLGRPAPKLVTRSIRERVLIAGRSGSSAQRGLAKVYMSLYGPVPAWGWGILGKIAELLGRDNGALFLLEHSYKPMGAPLRELLPQAIARARGYRPDDAPEVAEQRRFESAIYAAAQNKRKALAQ